MSVSFGNIKTGYVGQTHLTRQIRKRGFRLETSLDTDRIYAVIRTTCAAHPLKKKKLGGKLVADPDGKYGMLMVNSSLARRVISYGILRERDGGEQRIGVVQWGLVLTETDGRKALQLKNAMLANGTIQAVQEMEYFLNALEANLQIDDPAASIVLEL